MQEAELAFTEIGETSLVDSSGIQRPGMREVPLLKSLVRDRAEAGKVGAPGLKLCKRIQLVVIGEIVIRIELLAVVDPVVQAQSELVSVIVPVGNGLERPIGAVGVGHVLLQQREGHRVLAVAGNDVRRKNRGPGYAVRRQRGRWRGAAQTRDRRGTRRAS